MQGVEIFEYLKKYALVILGFFSGVAAKIATENSKKKITISQVWTTILTGLFAAFVAGVLCQYYKVDYYLSVGVIGVSAMNGENICAWILTNSSSLLTKLVNIFIKKNSK